MLLKNFEQQISILCQCKSNNYVMDKNISSFVDTFADLNTALILLLTHVCTENNIYTILADETINNPVYYLQHQKTKRINILYCQNKKYNICIR